MKREKRTFTQDEKEFILNLWRQGAGFSDIGRVLEAASGTTVFTVLRETGGVKPKQISRNKQHLTLEEREEVGVSSSIRSEHIII